jgi:hypothetical protein
VTVNKTGVQFRTVLAMRLHLVAQLRIPELGEELIKGARPRRDFGSHPLRLSSGQQNAVDRSRMPTYERGQPAPALAMEVYACGQGGSQPPTVATGVSDRVRHRARAGIVRVSLVWRLETL